MHTEDDNETTTTLSKLHSDSPDVPVSTDPATWINLSIWQRKNCLRWSPSNPTLFPHDSFGRPLPVSIFHKTLPNGESVLKNKIELQNCRGQG